MPREAGYTRVASTMDPHEVCALHRKNRYDLSPARPADARHGRLPGDQALKTNDATATFRCW
jgi:hypothetical protein